MRVIDLISQGRTKTSACDEVQISTNAYDAAVNANEVLHDIAVAAETRGQDTLADVLLEINSHAYYGTTDPKMAAILSKNIQWYLSRKRPKDYGDRVTVQHEITADKIIVDALTRGKDRAIAGAVLEGVVYTRDDEDEAEAAALRELY